MIASARSMFLVARSMATGRSPPKPMERCVEGAYDQEQRDDRDRHGGHQHRLRDDTPGSAKNSMNAKMTAPMTNSTIQTEVGMTLTAPWIGPSCLLAG
jgi:hypothetical protein